MRSSLYRFFVVGLIPIFSAAVFAKTQVIRLGTINEIKGLGPWSYQKNQSAEITTGASSIRIKAQAPGSFTVTNRKETLNIEILTPDRWTTWQALNEFVQKKLGLVVEVENSETWLRGHLLRAEDLMQLAKQCAKCDYRSELEMDDKTKTQLENLINEKLSKRKLKRLPLQWNPDAVWTLPAQDLQYISIARSLGIRIRVDPQALILSPNIETQIMVAEVRREYAKTLGTKWNHQIGAQVLPNWVSSGLASIQLEALESKGQARLLAHPTIIVRSGETAEFLAGGEFPIKIKSNFKSDVIWRRYGVVLKLKPQADTFGNIRMSIETEVSSIDPSRSVDGIPGLTSHKVATHFDLSKSRAIILSGLIKSEDAKISQGLPGLSSIPILGSLFGSEDFRSNQSEFLIIVQPRILTEEN
jgi:pilus assembly protein CpaC